MKKKITLITISVLTVTALKVSAQNSFSELIRTGPGDATKLVNAYAEPMFKGFGVGMNSGWNNTARTKKLLRFDLRITASVSFVPQSDKTFNVNGIGLSNSVRPIPGSPTTSPTISGGSSGLATLGIYDNNNQKVDQFTLPEGKISVIPAPQIQLTVGLVRNTDVTLRAIPKVKLGNDIGSVGMIGFGLKHNIIQDFTGAAGKLIPFDLAIAFGYNRLNLEVPLDVRPSAGALPAPGNTNTNFSNQRIEGHFNNFQLQAILSKKITVFTPFIAVGYHTSNTDVGTYGNFPVTVSSVGGQQFYQTYTNPISINQKSVNGMRADLGFQLELAFFRFYASYSAATYQSVNAGIGFGI